MQLIARRAGLPLRPTKYDQYYMYDV